jgi:hypothetical protein
VTDQGFAYATGALIAAVFLGHVLARRFDPFEPVWLFLVGYFHLYVIQPLSLREWAVGVRGLDVVTEANGRALWALAWLLAVYFFGPGRLVAARLPRPPSAWSITAVTVLSPLLVAWGFFCAWGVISQGWGGGDTTMSAEESLFRTFPFVMMVAGILLVVTGRQASAPRPAYLACGLGVAAAYVAIWMFNGKRSHTLIGVLSTVCAFYITRNRRPSWPVLLSTAFAGALVVALSIGWRNNYAYDRSLNGFVQYLSDFQVASILKSLNVEDDEEKQNPTVIKSYETVEYGGYLLMLDTVPEKSGYDYGANYIRTVSTFIPRLIWADKPIYGRDKWIAAWRAGSEFKREEDFAGPAIGILGATHLNGGAAGTFVVMAAVAVMLRAAYGFFRLYADVPWVQAWWSLTYYNAWMMVVTDDPMVWFYYNWGVTCLPTLALLWGVNKVAGAGSGSRESPAGSFAAAGA